VERKRLDSRCQGVHQDVAMEMRPFRGLDEKALMNMVAARHDLLLLVLDGVTDPHNLGACIRSAEAAGAAGLLIAKDKSAPVNATVRKVAAGSAERLPVFVVTNLARALEKCRAEGVWVTGLASEGVVSLWDLDLTGRTAIVLGSEGKGMRRLTREHCDHLACIPMAGEIESLNVSVAAGIALFESRRQRLYARID
jgi:23S rRNA (guanosine2251-2'-O)-methyltransferase